VFKKVYFDNAATTAVREEVVEAMAKSLMEDFGNPSSTHGFGRSSKSIVEQARKDIAKVLNAHSSEIIFTSGGTEADNLVLKSAVKDMGVEHIISTGIEHHAVVHTLDELEHQGLVRVHNLNLNSKGEPDLNQLEDLLKSLEGKVLISLMHVNNEIGNLLDIDRVTSLSTQYGALFHSDTVQSIGHFQWDLQKQKVDFLAVSAHKFHGPKGVGFAYIRKGHPIKALISGGSQEKGMRAGTESIHNIVGLAKALQLTQENYHQERSYIEGIKRYFIETLSREIPSVVFNGTSADFEKSTYTMVNVSIPIVNEKASLLLFNLDLKGIACSKGSACQSGSQKGSPVLSQILDEKALEFPALRFSFSKYNTREEVDYVVEVLKELLG
jgi:cysteine desulfurase